MINLTYTIMYTAVSTEDEHKRRLSVAHSMMQYTLQHSDMRPVT